MVVPTKTWRQRVLLALAAAPSADAFWRLRCSTIQTGRVDPIVSPGAVSGHAHKVSGASNFGFSNTFADLRASQCSSCEVQADKSAYWTPQLYYQHADGRFEEVPNGGTVVYYLGRGENRSNIEPFPDGFRMLSGNPTARSFDTAAQTYSNTKARIQGRPRAEQVSFACLDSRTGPTKQTANMSRTDCDNGLRAQVHFPSCWDGRAYQPDQSHVAHMSQIDNGVCPPSHPRQLIHLFFEVLYSVSQIKTSPGGKFVFAQGDTTGYGFHGDFMNGWDSAVLKQAVKECVNNDDLRGSTERCPPFKASITPYFSTNCPERPPLVDEPVKGVLSKLPGCNAVTSGPSNAPQQTCPTQPRMNAVAKSTSSTPMYDPLPGTKLNGWSYAGCALEPKNGAGRALDGHRFSADDMTIQKCADGCKAKGYPLSGVEYSRECYCATSLNTAAPLQAHNTCTETPKMACGGNGTQWCGAPGLINIWNDTSSAHWAPKSPATTKTADGTGTYLGCFAEPKNAPRLLNKASYSNSTVSVDQCVRFCQQGNHALAGVEYGGECWCGDIPKSPSLSESAVAEKECNMPCKGNPSQLCGAGSRVGVWNNTLYVPIRNPSPVIVASKPAFVYQGCYTSSSSSGRSLAKGSTKTSKAATMADSKGMTVEMCAKFCKDGGYGWMGVEYGQECKCNTDGLLNGATKVDDSECKMTCKGDNTEWCGAGGRLNVYKQV